MAARLLRLGAPHRFSPIYKDTVESLDLRDQSGLDCFVFENLLLLPDGLLMESDNDAVQMRNLTDTASINSLELRDLAAKLAELHGTVHSATHLALLGIEAHIGRLEGGFSFADTLAVAQVVPLVQRNDGTTCLLLTNSAALALSAGEWLHVILEVNGCLAARSARRGCESHR